MFSFLLLASIANAGTGTCTPEYVDTLDSSDTGGGVPNGWSPVKAWYDAKLGSADRGKIGFKLDGCCPSGQHAVGLVELDANCASKGGTASSCTVTIKKVTCQ